MTSEVIEGHIRSSFYLKPHFFSISYMFDIYSYQNLICNNLGEQPFCEYLSKDFFYKERTFLQCILEAVILDKIRI